MNFGIIGYGEIAKKAHEPAIKKLGGNLIATCDEHGDWHDIINHPRIDVVSIATPNYIHVTQTLAALDKGKKVILEKPIATNVTSAERLLQHPLTASNVAVCYQRRFNTVCQKIKAKQARPLAVEVGIHVRRDDPYWNTWRSDRMLSGGGNLMNIDIHYLDLLLWWLGDTYTIEFAQIATHQKYTTDVAVRAVMNFNGIPVTFSGSALWDKQEKSMKVMYPDETLIYSTDDASHFDVYSQFLNHGNYVTVAEAYKSLELVEKIYAKANH